MIIRHDRHDPFLGDDADNPGDEHWASTVFLDRDGVINRRIEGDYVRGWSQFEFLPGAIDAIARLTLVADRIVVVTNQAGVGKGLMSMADLDDIHARMTAMVAAGGGRIDGVFACPHTPADRCNCRKPATGLGEQARATLPDVDFARSVLVGDGTSDIAFGRALGMRTILVGPSLDHDPCPDADGRAPDLPRATDLLVGGWLRRA